MGNPEPVPELLVRVDYEVPPTRAISSMYFADHEAVPDEHYEKAMQEFHPTAILRGITRRLKPTNESCG